MKHTKTSEDVKSKLLEAALDYAGRGLHVFPVHTPSNGNKCSCGAPDCDNIGKHPRTKNGLNDATTDAAQIERFWHKWPNANIGGRTGTVSGIFVVDLDGPEAEDALLASEEKYGPLPATWESTTGRGRHLFFRHPGGHIPNSKSKIGAKIDVRGDGGYAVLAPSLHYSGRQYEWAISCAPDEIPIADAPPWLIDLIRKDADQSASRQGEKRSDLSRALDGLEQGERDEKIFKEACRLIALGLTRSEIEAVVKEAGRNCKPPFPEKLALRKVQSAFDTRARKNPDKPTGDDIVAAREQCMAMVNTLSQDPSVAVRAESIRSLALVREHDPECWVTATVALRKHHILREVEKQITRATKMRVVSRSDEPDEPHPLAKILSALGIPCPEGAGDLILPPFCIYDAEGTCRIEYIPDKEPIRHPIAPRIILVSEKLVDVASNEETLVLRHWSRGQWGAVPTLRSDALTAHKLVQTAAAGFPVGSHNAPEAAKFLFDLEHCNEQTLPVRRVTSQQGWLPDRTFMWGREHIAHPDSPAVSFRGADTGDEYKTSAFHVKGTLEGWIDLLRNQEIGSFPKARLALYASLSAPLIKILEARNYVVDIFWRTSTGKTVLLMLAASVWGDPIGGVTGGCVHSWNTTMVGAERLCALQSDMPICLDDTKAIKNPELISAILYMAISGQGRGRGSVKGLRAAYHWRTVLLSTGEGRLSSYMKDAGARARILPVGGYPFDSEGENTKRVVDAVEASCQQHYGHAGPAFVRWLRDNQDKWENFRERFSALKQKYEGSTGAASRIGDIAAIIDLAGELMHEALPMPWPFQSPFDTLWSSIKAEFGDIHIDVRAMRDVESWVVAHKHTFDGCRSEKEGAPPRGWSGRWDDHDPWQYIAFLPTVLKKALSDCGYTDFDAIVSGWKSRGWLDA